MKNKLKAVVAAVLLIASLSAFTGCTSKEEKAYRDAQSAYASARKASSDALDDYNELNDAIDNYYAAKSKLY